MRGRNHEFAHDCRMSRDGLEANAANNVVIDQRDPESATRPGEKCRDILQVGLVLHRERQPELRLLNIKNQRLDLQKAAQP
jgi:hypothetical protein